MDGPATRTTRPLAEWWFVDESKSRGYHVVAVAAAEPRLAAARKDLRALCRPGQRRLHFTRESEASRRQLTGALVRLPVRARVWSVRGRDDKSARIDCLAALVADASAVGAARLVFERDASIEAADRRILREELRRVDDTTMRYGHLDAHEEPLLWVADAVAWAQQAGGDWPRRFAPLVQQIRRLDRETRR